ncbi:hypothetical protein J2Z40_003361 [Cytobacillus eiseniae]|uniref:NERD domain-containing protein n=1 Tax=Cytobacillus eiseniae TaxID=762947 RepID=A0ABS4RIU1_9BACI|nr:nuclease-related domain-containing protein [Cytobacillus eiseniae]MBP2242781.1 hypothetical protein [Cytobacillus eiseniae]
MFLKERKEPVELLILRSLNNRMNLTANEQQQYSNIKKGYEGEVHFDSVITRLSSNILILNDLLLESNHSIFQIDSLLITQDLIIPCEIKNHEGNYYYQNENFYACTTNREITNPLHQLNRIETLLTHFLHKHGFKLPIKGYLHFIHPEFFLYQAPKNEKVIFYPQLNHFLKNIDRQLANLTKRHDQLANLLLDAHIKKSPISTRLPSYQYDNLKKGIHCNVCHSFQMTILNRKIICEQCGNLENTHAAVLRSVEELKLLFPNMKITVATIFDWCQFIVAKKVISKVLNKNYKISGFGQWAYYE